MKGKSLKSMRFAALALALSATTAPLGSAADRVSLFTNEAKAPAAVDTGPPLPHSTMDGATGDPSPDAARLKVPPGSGNERLRLARTDFDGLAGIRDGVLSGRAADLRLNLLSGVEFEAAIERSAPTSSGYSLSGPLRDVPFGRAVLVVNGSRVAGRIYTPDGMYAISTTGVLQSVERVVTVPLRCATGNPGEQPTKRGDVAGMPITVPKKSTTLPPVVAGSFRSGDPPDWASAEANTHLGGDDAVDVLVLYPSFIREIEGGYAPMLEIIDLDLATANEALAASGADLRFELAAAVEVEYDWLLDKEFDVRSFNEPLEETLAHLSDSNDGHLDEAHTLRDRHAADLVLLHLGGDLFRVMSGSTIAGIALSPSIVSTGEVERLGFAVARSGNGLAVAHELGHAMGLLHERYDNPGGGPFPYSHGFRFPDPIQLQKGGEWWQGTIMSSVRMTGDVPLFSNPHLGHPDDPSLKLGVPGDSPTTSPDGPADAVRHLNNVRHIVANVRSRADAVPCRYAISADDGPLPATGGTYRLRVDTGAGCTWAAAGGEWVASVSPSGGAGSGDIEYRVAANDGFERPVEVLVAGQAHTRRQAGSRPVKPLCERSIWTTIAGRHPDYESWMSCADIASIVDADPAYLASVSGILHPFEMHRGHAFRAGDFDGMTGLTVLHFQNVGSVPADAFSGLIGLRSLKLQGGVDFQFQPLPTTLRNIEPGAFRGLPGLMKLDILGHRVRTFGRGFFEGMPRLLYLDVTGQWDPPPDEPPPAAVIEPGTFEGLGNLRYLGFNGHSMNGLPAGAFAGLGRLEYLFFGDNELVSLAPDVFEGLAHLPVLNLGFNRFETLPVAVFAHLPNLEELHLQKNRLAELPVGVFDGLANLEQLRLYDNRLTRVRSGLFDGLRSLRFLYLGYNALEALEPGVFSPLTGLEGLWLGSNALRDLPAGLFRDLDTLTELALWENRLGVLRSGVFEGLDDLRHLNLGNAGITALEPNVFDAMPYLASLSLRDNDLRDLPHGVFEGLATLRQLDLRANPGTPFTFALRPVRIDPTGGSWPGLAWRQPAAVGIEVAEGAPSNIAVKLVAEGGSLEFRRDLVGGEYELAAGEVRRFVGEATPNGDGPVTVHVDGPPRPRTHWCNFGFILSFSIAGARPIARKEPVWDFDTCYPGTRLVAGPPLVLYGIADRELAPGRGPEAIDLVEVFAHFLGADAEFAASSSDPSVAAVDVADSVLTVTPGATGTSTVTATATGADGRTLSREFAVTVRAPSVPLLPSDAGRGAGGFVRLVNRSGRPGEVRVAAFDDRGVRRGPVTVRIGAHAVAHFTAGDLERGNAAKDPREGVGIGEGDWWLEFESDLDVEALSYLRSGEGYLASLHDVARGHGAGRDLALFGASWSSRLRVVNTGRKLANVVVRGVDEAGTPLPGMVRFRAPPGTAQELRGQHLWKGGWWLDGALGGDGGWWRLRVESDVPVSVMGLLEDTATGRLSNLSSGPVAPDAAGTHHVPLFLAAPEGAGRLGVVRVVNRSPSAGVVDIAAFDEAGERRGPLELAVGAGAAARFDSADLELGNAAQGLSGSAGTGEGDWRLELNSDLDIAVYAYVRGTDGFLTTMHEVVAPRNGRVVVPVFNSGSNAERSSQLRLVNPHGEDVDAAIIGGDDLGRVPHTGQPRTVVTVPARGALTLTAAELEAGVLEDDPDILKFRPDHWPPLWRVEPLGDGAGKWRLTVDAERPLLVMSLLESSTGELTNLSTAPEHGRSVRQAPD